MEAIWKYLASIFKRLFLNLYLEILESRGASLTHRLIVSLEMLNQPNAFKHYTWKKGRTVQLTPRSRNVTEFFEALNYLATAMNDGGYLDVDIFNIRPDRGSMSLDDFLLTKNDNYPVRPQEVVEELIGLLRSIHTFMPVDEDSPSLEYYMRKSGWVFEDAQTLTEALHRAMKIE